MKNTWTINKIIKNHWLKIIIILFTCFIIIPVILKSFKINEGFDVPLNIPPELTPYINILINYLNSTNEVDIDLSKNVYRKSDSIKDIYDTSGNNLLNTILSKISVLSTKIDDMKKIDVPIENIKCIADFGTNIGDPLCCGQSGILTDTKYVCPANYSKCESMKCGSKYGTCVKA